MGNCAALFAAARHAVMAASALPAAMPDPAVVVAGNVSTGSRKIAASLNLSTHSISETYPSFHRHLRVRDETTHHCHPRDLPSLLRSFGGRALKPFEAS
jgi:hypothetical protein